MLIPLAGALLAPASLSAGASSSRRSRRRARSPRTGSRFGASLVAALVNAVFGLIVAWVLVRYRFPGRGARSTRWSTCRSRCRPRSRASRSPTLLAKNGWLGRWLEPLGIQVAYTPLGIDDRAHLHRPAVRGAHGAAGARGSRARSSRRPPRASARRAGRRSAACSCRRCWPALVTGFALAFARGARRVRLGRLHLRQHADADRDRAAADRHQARAVRLRGATAIAAVMLVASFALLLGINALQGLGAPRRGAEVSVTPRATLRTALSAPASVRAALHRSAAGARRADRARAALPRRSSSSLPLVAVFAEALAGGLRPVLRRDHRADGALGDPADAARRRRSPCRSTRCSASPRRGRSRGSSSPGKSVLITADRPAVRGVAGDLGPDLRAALRRAGLLRTVAADARHPDHLRGARHRARDHVRHLPVRRARADPADAGAGRRGGGGRAISLGASGWQTVLARDAAEDPLGPALRRRAAATRARWASSARCRSCRATSAARPTRCRCTSRSSTTSTRAPPRSRWRRCSRCSRSRRWSRSTLLEWQIRKDHPAMSIEVRDICEALRRVHRAARREPARRARASSSRCSARRARARRRCCGMIAGLEYARRGLDLASTARTPPSRSARERRVGFVFQHYALFRHMTVFENVAFGLRVRPRRQRPAEAAIQARVHELLDLVQLEGLGAAHADAALGRPAPARRARARAGGGAARAAARRAVRRARRARAPRAAPLAAPAARRPRHHEPVRHARPGGGARARRPRRGDERGPDRAGRRAGRGLPPARDAVRVRLPGRGELARLEDRRPGGAPRLPAGRHRALPLARSTGHGFAARVHGCRASARAPRSSCSPSRAPVQAEVPAERVRSLSLAPGLELFAAPRELQVFFETNDG